MKFKDNIVLVTGGSGGIGQAIAMAFAREGATVIIHYHHNQQEAERIATLIQEEGHRVETIQANIASLEEVTNMMDHIQNTYGKMDVLINNAGLTRDNLILRMSEEEFDTVINTNLKGTWNCCKQASKMMAKQRYGKIINISSVVGLVGNAGQSNYSASKAGILGLTKSLAKELAKRGICVNAIAPGFIETKMTQKLSSEWVEEIKKNIPLGRLGKPEDVANVALFLASPEADYLTGQTIQVDGGMVMSS
jgi:3-oxoacyl-[acyl-carrier protein] reductase